MTKQNKIKAHQQRAKIEKHKSSVLFNKVSVFSKKKAFTGLSGKLYRRQNCKSKQTAIKEDVTEERRRLYGGRLRKETEQILENPRSKASTAGAANDKTRRHTIRSTGLRLTAVFLVISDVLFSRRAAQLVQTEVGNLEDPARGHDAVGRLEVAVTMQVSFVQVYHAFDEISDHGRYENRLQLDVVVLENVL